MRALALIPLLLLATALFDAWSVVAAPHAPRCPADAALVMGAAQYDGAPSPAFERRLEGALELYRSGCVERIVVSGGRRPGDRFTEGEAGRSWLLAAGVPGERVVAENEATTSVENVALGLAALAAGDAPGTSGALVVVTDDLHAHRSLWLARRAGVDASAYGVGSGAGARWSYAAREIAIMAFYRVFRRA